MCINYNSKLIRIEQGKPNDWLLFVDVNMNEWTILFNGIKPSQKDFNSERINSYGLTGCLNFYNTTFENSSIKVKNGKCEDSLNIIKSKGFINNIEIDNAYSDGLDADFSNISIDLISVFNSGNDCLDVSAGEYVIKKIKAKMCGDKGVSVGEKSNMSIELLEVEDAKIGLSSKDSSITSVENYSQKNVKNCFEVMRKKQEFGGAKLNLIKDKCNNNLIDNDSRILLYKLWASEKKKNIDLLLVNWLF